MSIGMHVSKKGRGSKSRKMNFAITEDLNFMESYGIANPSAQIFVTGPKTFKETLAAEEKAAIRRVVEQRDCKLVIHGAYVDRPWGNIPGAVHNVKQELRIGAEIGATGVIVHLSAGCGVDAEFRRALTSISDIELETPQTLWLEIHAAKSSDFTYETPAKISNLFRRIETYGLNNPVLNIGLCIDTAHLFACGTSLETLESARDWMQAIEAVQYRGAPLKLMMHLNDSASTFASGIDKHAPLACGNIWSAYHPATGRLPFERSGLAYLLEYCDSKSIVTILERDDHELHKDLKLIHDMGFYHK